MLVESVSKGKKGPAATVEVVRKLIGGGTATVREEAKPPALSEAAKTTVEEEKTSLEVSALAKASNGDTAKAEVAAEVADSAQKLDGGPQA